MAAEGVGALLVSHLPNIRYLTGFTGSAALLLVRHDGAVLFTENPERTNSLTEAISDFIKELQQP